MEKQKRILVVDNDPFQRINCRVMLRGVEFIVLFGECMEEALERVWKEEFDLIFTNIRLPNRYCGLTTLQEMKLMKPKADIVVMADEPSLWDAWETMRLGASGYAERPFTPECLVNVARKSFDKEGWIVKKAHIDQFRDYCVPSSGTENSTLYYKNGSWARHLQGGLWEVGYDMKYWLPSGRHKNDAWAKHLHDALPRADYDTKSRLAYDQTLSLALAQNLSALKAGEPYARISAGPGRAYQLRAPMSGIVEEINGEAKDILASRVPEDLGADWLLWLARIKTREEFGVAQNSDIEAANLVGTYQHCPV
ncbi:MAG TPA: response regulator [Thermodesulfovibrionales bacterium]|nr:response regulator [Thermodesulfovibrionales bacterium]